MSAGLTPQPHKWIRFFPVAAAILVVLTGSAALVGWPQSSTLLKNISPQFVSLKADEALALVMLGAALAVAACASRRALRWLGAALALAAFALGAATLLAYSANVDLGIDQFLVRAPL